MSADAKVWMDGDSGWTDWRGIDDDCDIKHGYDGATLVEILAQIETCMGGRHMRWEFRVYPDGQVGLVGYCQ